VKINRLRREEYVKCGPVFLPLTAAPPLAIVREEHRPVKDTEINFPKKASPGRGKLSPQVTDEGAGKQQSALNTPHPALRATFPPRGEGFCIGSIFKS
jgi:hypothetical protein